MFEFYKALWKNTKEVTKGQIRIKTCYFGEIDTSRFLREKNQHCFTTENQTTRIATSVEMKSFL